MINTLKTLILTALLFSFCTHAFAHVARQDTLPYRGYYEKGNSLQHFYQIVSTRKKATVTFLGGSITYNPGWRQKVCAYLQQRFPEVKFHFIAAGIPSLGSLPHVFRLQQDVLDSGKTDLLFIEAAVNDRVNGTDSLTQVRDLEGIVRHAKKSNPNMDMVLMAFADPDETSDYDKGIVPVEVYNHQLIAGHYQLAFINLAKEVRDKISNKEFSWANDFKDIHPAPFGEQLYFNNIKSLLDDCFDHPAEQTGGATVLPEMLNKASFVNGRYYAIKNAVYKSGWAYSANWKPTDGLGTREGFVNIPILSADEPGATLTLAFKGTAVGIAIVSGADAGIINYSIDGGVEKSIDLHTQWSGFLHLPWYLLLGSDLERGKHELKITVSDKKNDASKGHTCRIVNFLVNGK